MRLDAMPHSRVARGHVGGHEKDATMVANAESKLAGGLQWAEFAL